MIGEPDLLQTYQHALAHGVTEELVHRIEAAVNARRDERSGHAQWGLLCEQAGLWQLAFREFQLALRDDPYDATALERLVHHYNERGDAGRAAEALQRLIDLQPSCFQWWYQYLELLIEQEALVEAGELIESATSRGLDEQGVGELRRRLDECYQKNREELTLTSAAYPEPIISPTDADCVRFCSLFSGREDVYARQWARKTDTGYTPIHQPLTPSVIHNHLIGNHTVGVYPLRLDGTATFFAVDLDIDRSAMQRARSDHAYAQWLRDTIRKEGPQIAAAMREYGFFVLFENSGYKGRHYWVFLEKPETAATLHVLGKCLLHRLHPLISPGFHLEFFPKQAELKGKGLGNLIKLPLGIHQRNGRRSVLLDETGQVISDPLGYLRTVRRCPSDVLYRAIERLKQEMGGATEEKTEPASAGAAAPGEVGESPAQPSEPPAPLVPPLPPPPQWTEADFQLNGPVRHVLQCCPVLAELKRRVDEHRHLTYEEQLVLIHTMGHLESGPLAVNYLLQKCVDVGPDKQMKSRLRGNPMSCATIRRKIPHITSRVPCNCDFSFAPDRYPHPVVHLLTFKETPQSPPQPGEPEPLEQVALRLAHLEQRRRELEKEFQQLHHVVVERLRRTVDRAVRCEAGCYRLIEKEGIEELLWEPAANNSNQPTEPEPENVAENNSSADVLPPFSTGSDDVHQPNPSATDQRAPADSSL